jgi:hypothetical protein
MAEIELRNGIHDSTDLLGLTGEEEVASKEPHELFKVVLFTLAEDGLDIMGEQLCRDGIVSGEDINH